MEERFSEQHEPLPDDPAVGDIQLRVGLIQGQADNSADGADGPDYVEDALGMSILDQHQPGLQISSQRAEASNPNSVLINQQEQHDAELHAIKQQRTQLTHDNRVAGVDQYHAATNISAFNDRV